MTRPHHQKRKRAVTTLKQRGAHPVTEPDEISDLPEQMRVRREKYDRLMADPDRAPFPVLLPRTASLADEQSARSEHVDAAGSL